MAHWKAPMFILQEVHYEFIDDGNDDE